MFVTSGQITDNSSGRIGEWLPVNETDTDTSSQQTETIVAAIWFSLFMLALVCWRKNIFCHRASCHHFSPTLGLAALTFVTWAILRVYVVLLTTSMEEEETSTHADSYSDSDSLVDQPGGYFAVDFIGSLMHTVTILSLIHI